MAKVREARDLFSTHTDSQQIAVNCVFYFQRERIYCKNGKPKRLDVDNRLKHSLDQVSKLLHFDDSMIFQGGFYKRVTPSKIEFCNVGLRWVSQTSDN